MKLAHNPACFFSKSPLNYDTLLSRFRLCQHAFPPHCDPHALILDSIRAARKLQLSSDNFNRTTPASKLLLDISSLGLSLKNDPVLIETSLWSFLLRDHHQSFTSSAQLMKAFFTIAPTPILNERVLNVAQAHCRDSEHSNKQLDAPLIFIALSLLLEHRDYSGAFKLINVSFASPHYLQLCSMRLKRLLVQCIMAICATTAFEFLFMPMIPCTSWLVFNTVALVTATIGPKLLIAVTDLPRVGWRSHISLWKKITHQQELVAVNKVIRHFEEHNEINIVNFHYGEARKPLNLGEHDFANYTLVTPLDSHATNQKMHRLFKKELQFRKMRTKDLALELIFLEFWSKHGEGYEWTEPDQDPAEIEKLRIK